MAIVDLIMPKLGESIMEATILKWHKKTGDNVKQDETVLDIATDKVDSEVPSTDAGVITEILFKENDVVPIGVAIARIETSSNGVAKQAVVAPAETNAASTNNSNETNEEEQAHYVPFVPTATTNTSNNNGSGIKFYSPLVLNIASSEGITLSELEKINGTGNEGRVTKRDILNFVENRKTAASTKYEVQSTAAAVSNQTSEIIDEPLVMSNEQPSGKQEETKKTEKLAEEAPTTINKQPATNSYEGQNVEIIEMDRMRKLIANHMVNSKHTSPHVTSFAEADVTNMVMWREKVKADFEKRENTKITFTPIFIDCLVRVIKRFPMINSSVDGDKIIIKKDINIGMAMAMPSGNLIVPVIRNADYLNLVGLSKQVNNLANNARNNKLRPDDTQGGTFTLTNVGTFGSLMGTPIINQPQAAILAVGAIKKRPVVIETKHGDTIGIRHMMYLSLSYDHRIIDGSLGASFLTAVAKEFEAWEVEKTW